MTIMLTLFSSIFDANTGENTVLFSPYWGKFGVGFILNLCNLSSELFRRGLQNLHPPVQIWVLPSLKTSLCAGFSCPDPLLKFCPVGVKYRNNQGYWGTFGLNLGVILGNSNFAPMAKASAGTPQIKNSNGRLQIVLSQKGKRSYLSLGIPDSKQNRAYAQMIVTRIWNDILAGHYTGLEKYKRDPVSDSSEPAQATILSLSELWERYTDYKRPQLSQTTIAKDFERIRRNIDKFPGGALADAVAVRDYLIKSATPGTAKRVLTHLGAACAWAIKSNLITTNPFLGMSADIKIGKGESSPDINPFTSKERDQIIQKFREMGSHYAPLVEFLFRTGCRPSEAIGLQVKHVEPECRSFTFRQSVTVSEKGLTLKQGLKTQSHRVFPCGDGLQTFLKSLTYGDDQEHFLFLSPQGKFINVDRFSRREWRPMLKSLDIAERGIYQCRHSYITFCIDSGMDAKDVAKLVGNSAEIIYRHYAGAKRGLAAPDI